LLINAPNPEAVNIYIAVNLGMTNIRAVPVMGSKIDGTNPTINPAHRRGR
jgi:hypothetical protein